MKISRKTDYALRALVGLATVDDGGLRSIRQLAAENDIPKRFLEQIMIELRERGWVRALAGRDGGYQLAIPAAELSVGQVVRHFDGVLAPIGCVSVAHYQACSQEKTCRFRRLFLDLRNHTASLLDRLTLADLRESQPVDNQEIHALDLLNGAGI